jgi:hypothetical protein
LMKKIQVKRVKLPGWIFLEQERNMLEMRHGTPSMR